jgi:hypothetical protein
MDKDIAALYRLFCGGYPIKMEEVGINQYRISYYIPAGHTSTIVGGTDVGWNVLCHLRPDWRYMDAKKFNEYLYRCTQARLQGEGSKKPNYGK